MRIRDINIFHVVKSIEGYILYMNTEENINIAEDKLQMFLSL